MRLYIKQMALSWRCRFNVMDASGQDRWFAEGEFFSFTHRLHVYNAQDNEVAHIYRENWTLFTQQYHIELANGPSFMLVKEFTFFMRKFHLRGLPWHMEGDFLAHDYYLYDEQGVQMMHIYKEWLTWGDSYVIDIRDPRYELLCLCIVLAVDSMVEDSSH